MFKLCAIVTSYYPNLEELEQNIRSYLSDVDKLIIWENTPKNESRINELVKKLNNEKIEVRTTGRNEYLAKPFNICIEWAKQNGYTHILTMDQDSCFAKYEFGAYKEKVAALSKDESIAIFAPTTNKTDQKEPDIIYINKGSVYTSGAIYRREMFDKIGGFREDFAIYCLDPEICIRARKNNYKVIKFPQIYMKHTEGYRTKKLGLTINNYSAQSTYFYIRNNILFWKIYPTDFQLSVKFNFIKYHVIYRIAKIGFEKNRTAKLKAIFLGILHGIKMSV